MHVKLGCGQITWRDVAEDVVLADIAAAGYAGAPWSQQPGGAEEIRRIWGRHGLVPAPGYLWGDYWDRSKRDENLAAARRSAEVSQELGLTEVYVAAEGFDYRGRSGRTRRAAVGHTTPDDGLSDEEFRVLTDTLQAVGEVMLEHGVRACFHNHGGTVVEREDEVERLLEGTDPETVFLGPDTGHLAWAGIDVVGFAGRHADRIKTMHIKDVDFTVRDRGVAAGWDYATYEENAVWTEIGSGEVDFPGLFNVLSEADFDGWLIVETDITQLGSPAESATVSREALRQFGI